MALRKTIASLTCIDLEPENEGPQNILVMLHGYGSNEKDLIQLAPSLGQGLRYISIRAPLQLAPEMYGWFPIEFTPGGITYDPELAAEARQRLSLCLQTIIETLRPRGGKVWLMGFSQGAVMSYLTALSEPSLLHGVIALSGKFPDEAIEKYPVTDTTALLPFLVMHGTYDEVLPVAHARHARVLLQNEVSDFCYKEYPAGHTITMEALDDLNIWLEARLGNRSGN
ncbi:alpha/beta hydrolase [Prosthecochloris sp. HL-130-GSB]|jgi:phospholipase/carboxylesterase|uniref:alpha/beta hydrolase n=1 Tax=Prosthecochloris sp. HL-130-GSB TaxID=1974213 RepID=UPI000A1C1791|nr:phospholipase [Prosthecochloris sp. HL-130-GSB]ARM31488.1 phospholipase [Prosthecochloris sp. HL-130-GSB]